MTLWRKHQNSDIRETGEHSVEQQLSQKGLQWFGHMQRMPDNRMDKQLRRCRPEGKKRLPGGTQLRWVDLLNRDLAPIPNWKGIVQDRDEWRFLINWTRTVIVL